MLYDAAPLFLFSVRIAELQTSLSIDIIQKQRHIVNMIDNIR